MRSRLLVPFVAVAVLALAFGAAPAAHAQESPRNGGSPVAQAGQAPQPQAPPASPQAPQAFMLQRLRVEGVDRQSMRDFVRRTSGLAQGQQVTLPGGDAVAEAIRSIYSSGLFSDVSIVEDRRTDEGISLTIRVTPEPTLAGYSFTGVGGDRDDLEEKMPLVKGRPVRRGDVERAEKAIKAYYADEGHLLADVSTERQTTPSGQARLNFRVNKGNKVEVDNIRFEGNTAFDDGDLRGAFDETQENRWWRFWKSETFDEDAYEDDLDALVNFYNQRGYYDATIVRDSVYVSSDDGLTVDVTVREGDRYHIRNIEWDGNTVYSNQLLTNALGFEKGDVYDSQKLQENLRFNRSSTDVTSLYTDRGYVGFNVQPNIRVVEGDSLDLVFEIREGEVWDVGNVEIAGNTKTNEHVIRRELYTIPGQTFSRSDIQESIRRLGQLGYFDQQALQKGPTTSFNQQQKQVDLTYKVKETSSDQLELSGTYGGFGLVLQLGFTFNNFSAQELFDFDEWKPLPAGDGQKLSLSVRTAGLQYQNYSISFTEPWFNGRPTPVGGSVAFSHIEEGAFRSDLRGVNNDADGVFTRFSTQLFRRQRLDWPDDKFSISSTVNYNFYGNDDGLYSTLPEGDSHQLSFKQGILRNSLNNSIFPTRGSRFELSLEVAPPVGDLIQFHKWRFETDWNVPLTRSGKLTFNVGTNYGYIGSLTGDEVQFQRFDLGGSPFDYGRQSFGTEPIFMRGYPAQALNPLENNQFAPGRILNKYTSELRFLAVESAQLRAAPYVFADAGNTWSSFDTFNPAQLYRSAGVGARLYLPIVGLIDVSYGYNFDRFPGERIINGVRPLEDRGWRFQISFGQGGGF